jgi:rare lipoprotein A
MSDEGFHEIQLNGKQLVFLFMAATVVSVVIFLCGVMVGRGVRDRAASTAGADGTAVAATAAEAAGTGDAGAARSGEPAPTSGSAQPQGTPAAAASPPPDQAPPTPAEEDGDYYDSLVKERSDTKLATPASRAPAKTPDAPAAKKSAAAAATAAPAPPAVPDQGPMTSGYAVQLVAVRERNEADAIAKRLVSKGYQAYVLVPQPGKPPVYRVQVGRFTTRGDADKIATRLRKEEQFKPWVTR